MLCCKIVCVCSVLKGGYNLTTISESMCSVARVLLGEAPPMLDEPCVPSKRYLI